MIVNKASWVPSIGPAWLRSKPPMNKSSVSKSLSTEMIPFSTRNWIPFRKSESLICPWAHQAALFLIQSGIVSDFSWLAVTWLIWIISSLSKNSIPLRKSLSGIKSSDHHPAVFFTHSGTCACAFPIDEIENRISIEKNITLFIMEFIFHLQSIKYILILNFEKHSRTVLQTHFWY